MGTKVWVIHSAYEDLVYMVCSSKVKAEYWAKEIEENTGRVMLTEAFMIDKCEEDIYGLVIDYKTEE